MAIARETFNRGAGENKLAWNDMQRHSAAREEKLRKTNTFQSSFVIAGPDAKPYEPASSKFTV